MKGRVGGGGSHMKGRVGGGGGGGNGGAPTDLLVCLPSRHHLTLMPKPICSPSRPTEASKRRSSRSGANRGQASPLFKTKTKHMSSEIAEPTSPKVTCAGQIKVRAKPRPSGNGDKDWLSVVEEIEKLRKNRKKPNWLEALGFKKEFMQFLGALRGLRFDMRCFGSVDCTTDEEDGEEDEEEEEEKEVDSSGSRNIFSKWFMVLEENQELGYKKEVEEEAEEEEEEEEEDVTFEDVAPPSSVPPPNALLLMRCRSAPAKGWLEGEGGGAGEEEVTAKLMREKEKEKERMLLMSYAPDFFKVSTEIAKETWVVGSMDPLARSRSWKR